MPENFAEDSVIDTGKKVLVCINSGLLNVCFLGNVNIELQDIS